MTPPPSPNADELPPEGYVSLVQEDGASMVVRADLEEVARREPAAFWAEGAPLESAAGRGDGVSVLRFEGRDGPVCAVARDFRRGGVLGSLLGDRYFDRARAVRELRVLDALRRAGLPVVEPIAAVRRPRGMTSHRLRLLTALVEGAVPLPVFVDAHPALRAAAVRAAGALVDRALAAGLIHRDLHADNLIARVGEKGEPELWLLDLDRAKLVEGSVATGQRDAMLLRMARYLVRHRDRVRANASDSLRFLAGAGLDRAARRAEIERLRPAFRRMLERHGLAEGGGGVR